MEDSEVVRHLLEYIINSDERLEVALSVSTAEEALARLPGLRPDIISMDINLPGMDGLEATHRIMTEQPTPILIVSSSIADQEANTSLEALRAGALTVAEKPVGIGHPHFDVQATQLINKLVIMSEVPVVRQRQGRYLRTGGPSPQGGITPTDFVAITRKAEIYLALGVVASTGGPQALVRLFTDLGNDFPLPVFLVQHITPAFVDSFARWLESVTRWKVIIAEEGTRPVPGHIYIAPADCHLRVEPGGATGNVRLTLSGSPLVSGQRPSGSELFSSMAATYGRQAIGVLLTGMGEDGADGLLAMRTAGAHTIAEDQSTAIVYGMPAAAVNRGAATETLPLHRIGGSILALLRPQPMTSENRKMTP